MLRFSGLASLAAFFSVCGLPLVATPEVIRDPGAATGYREPAPEVTALLTAPTPPEPLLHMRSGGIALLYREPVITLERVSRNRLGLAGFRYEVESGTSGLDPLIKKVEIVSARDPQATPVVWTPGEDTVLDFVRFSPDGKTLSALAIGKGAARLALFDISSSKERFLALPLNAAWGEPCQWTNQNDLICRVQPEDRGPAPAPHPAPVQVEHMGGAIPMRTYQNLLENAYDDELFEYYFTTELARIDRSGAAQRYPFTRGLLKDFEVSPDGRFAVVTQVLKPYSRLVPARKFPSSIELWDLGSGQRLYASKPAGFGIDDTEDGDEDPTRSEWMPGSTNTLGFIEKDRDAEGRRIYRWMIMAAPFDIEPVEIVSSSKLIRRFGWTSAGTAYFTTSGDSLEEVNYLVVRDGHGESVWRGVAADRYDNPGRAIRVDGGDGPVLEVDERIFIAGDGLSDCGPRPFLDTIDLQSLEVSRLFESEPGVFEVVLGVLDPALPSFITSRETEAESPNLYLRTGSESLALTHIPDPYPQLAATKRQLITYRRADGVELSGTLYLPAGYQEGTRLPTLVWIYPTEFTDEDQAEQMDLRFFRFHRVKGPSPLAAVVAGYALLLNPTVPIVYEEGAMSDNYLPQLLASVDAALDYLVEQGYSQPDRFAVAGRSYGAFSAANLLAHSDRFATAIPMSGAYNRTLTPFGFQHEHRSLWEATELYTRISPFFYADEIDHPILIIHGGSDENPGTITFQARRFFHALIGEGATARYVELPYEGHHYWARENVLLASAEMLDWLNWTIGPASITSSE